MTASWEIYHKIERLSEEAKAIVLKLIDYLLKEESGASKK